jgi:hypothetical protein
MDAVIKQRKRTGNQMKLEIRCYGVFREIFQNETPKPDNLPDDLNYSFSGDLKLMITVDPGLSVNQLKLEIVKKLKNHPRAEVVSRSVLANDSRILKEDDLIQEDMRLSILPPVCGG